MEKQFNGPQLSLSDCYAALSCKLNTTNFKILTFQQLAFDEINGYLGEHCTLKITILRKGCEKVFTFFVKFAPSIPSQLNFLTEINGIFKEQSFYTKFVPLLKIHGITLLDDTLPACYYNLDGTFIFEDLKARGYATLPSRNPLDIDHVKAALVAFAKLHASGLILEETKSFRLTDDFGVELKESFYLGTDSTERAMKSCKQGIKALIDITHRDEMPISKDVFKDNAVKGCDLQKMFTKPSRKFRNTICHADPWTKNFLFQQSENGVDCVIVDFQTYRYGPPAQDVLAFLFLVSNRQFRSEHLEEMLEFYFRELKRNTEQFGFVNIVTREEFFESCDYFKQFALTQTLTHFQVVILSDEIASELFGDPEEARRVLFEDKYEFFKMVCRKDPIFREKNFEAIADLREFWEIKLSEEN